MKVVFFSFSIFLNFALMASLAFIMYLSTEDTMYSQDYNEASFSSIVCGMNHSSVEERIGPPLFATIVDRASNRFEPCESVQCFKLLEALPNTSSQTYVSWTYSRQKGLPGYQLRSVHFSPNGEVRKTIAHLDS